MSAGYHHFIIEQGATFGQTLTLKDSAGSTVSLIGFTGRMTLRESPTATDTVQGPSLISDRLQIWWYWNRPE